MQPTAKSNRSIILCQNDESDDESMIDDTTINNIVYLSNDFKVDLILGNEPVNDNEMIIIDYMYYTSFKKYGYYDFNQAHVMFHFRHEFFVLRDIDIKCSKDYNNCVWRNLWNSKNHYYPSTVIQPRRLPVITSLKLLVFIQIGRAHV